MELSPRVSSGSERCRIRVETTDDGHRMEREMSENMARSSTARTYTCGDLIEFRTNFGQRFAARFLHFIPGYEAAVRVVSPEWIGDQRTVIAECNIIGLAQE